MKQHQLVYIVIILASFMLYGNTISHGYVLDDSIVITQNNYTQKGIAGIPEILSNDSFTGWHGLKKNVIAGGRYRPLSLVSFAIEYQFFGANPHVSHFLNILFYALTGILIYIILSRLIQTESRFRQWYLSIPFLTAMLFIIHPVHTEVVANIKARDEIFALLFSLWTMLQSIQYINTKKTKHLIFSFMLFFLALLSKENAITFLAILPLTIYFFTAVKKKEMIISILPLLIATTLFFAIRSGVMGKLFMPTAGDLMNNPFAGASLTERYATISFVLGKYLQLLFFPHPLTVDYYPYHIPLVNWNSLRAIIPLIIYLAMAYYALKNLTNKNRLAYAILFYFITLSVFTNIFINIGTFMNERFLYMPSLGFVFGISFIMSHHLPEWIKKQKIPFKKYETGITILLIIITIMASIKTINRNKVWESNFTLFATDVKTSPNSAFSNASAGNQYLAKANKTEDKRLKHQYLDTAIMYINSALDIHPRFEKALHTIANAYHMYNKNDSAIYYYERFMEVNPNKYDVNYNLGALYGNYKKNINKATEHLQKAIKLKPNKAEPYLFLGTLYLRNQRVDKAIQYLEKARKRAPQNYSLLKNLGVAYFYNKNYTQSLKSYKAALNLNKNDKSLYRNMALVYEQLGKKEKAQYFYSKAR